MNYSIILPVVVGWLVVRHARSPVPSGRSKRIVVGVAAGVFLIALVLPTLGASTWGSLLVIGAYVILHQEIMASGK